MVVGREDVIDIYLLCPTTASLRHSSIARVSVRDYGGREATGPGRGEFGLGHTFTTRALVPSHSPCQPHWVDGSTVTSRQGTGHRWPQTPSGTACFS